MAEGDLYQPSLGIFKLPLVLLYGQLAKSREVFLDRAELNFVQLIIASLLALVV